MNLMEQLEAANRKVQDRADLIYELVMQHNDGTVDIYDPDRVSLTFSKRWSGLTTVGEYNQVVIDQVLVDFAEWEVYYHDQYDGYHRKFRIEIPFDLAVNGTDAEIIEWWTSYCKNAKIHKDYYWFKRAVEPLRGNQGPVFDAMVDAIRADGSICESGAAWYAKTQEVFEAHHNVKIQSNFKLAITDCDED